MAIGDPPFGSGKLGLPQSGAGWHCPGCGGVHGPHVDTCPLSGGMRRVDLLRGDGGISAADVERILGDPRRGVVVGIGPIGDDLNAPKTS